MIVGTAGHIDHGKSSLVKALTGVDPDRLAEEKTRGITIDLGFAYLPAPNGEAIGFVDVPGHEKLVHTMLAGASGIDFVMLTVAADDGPMPQTVEHLQILDLLGLTRGIVIVTKADLADGERRQALCAEISSLLADTALKDADIFMASAVTGEGLEAVRARLFEQNRRIERRVAGRFRLAIDRCFTLKGAGTIVTGTAVAGRIKPGDHLLIMPKGLEARVRSIHAQDRAVEEGGAGLRCAINLTGPGIDKAAIRRGDWAVAPESRHVTDRADVRLRLLGAAMKPLGAWSAVHFHAGASHVTARLVPLREGALKPGESDFGQIVFDAPLALQWGDRFIIRDAGGQTTLGGGVVLDVRPPRRKRRSSERRALLAAMAEPDPARALIALLALPPGWLDFTDFCIDRNLSREEAEALTAAKLFRALPSGEKLIALTENLWSNLAAAVRDRLASYHAERPDRAGLSADQLLESLGVRLPRPAFAAFIKNLIADGALSVNGPWLHLPEHKVRLSSEDEQLWRSVFPLIESDKFRPPRTRDIANLLRQPEERIRRLLKLQVRLGELEEIAHDHFFSRRTVAEMARIAAAISAAQPKGAFSAAEFRDQLHNGRKVAIQILEYFDRNGLTIRIGDRRRVVKKRLELFDEFVKEG